MKTISFSILFSTLQLFFNPLFFPFLQQFTAGENLRVAGDSAGRWRILTTLRTMYSQQSVCFWIFDVNGFWCENDIIRLETLFTKTLLSEVTLFKYNVSRILLLIVGLDMVMVTTCT